MEQSLEQSRREDAAARATRALAGLKAGAKKALAEARNNPLPYAWHKAHIKFLRKLAR
jgi:hypothetical protein